MNRLVRALFWHSSLILQVSREAGWMDAGQPSGFICEGCEFLLLGPCRGSCLVSVSAASSQRGDRTCPRGRTLQRKSADRGGGRRRRTKGRAHPRKMKTLTFLLPVSVNSKLRTHMVFVTQNIILNRNSATKTFKQTYQAPVLRGTVSTARRHKLQPFPLLPITKAQLHRA